MGQACVGGDSARQVDQRVATLLETDRLKDTEVKLLLLGAGESGKSTLFKVRMDDEDFSIDKNFQP